jgi:anthranilate phosphoribosyltransferase
MSIAAYIREIGRGKEGARSLSFAQAHDLMSQVLDGRVTDLEIGAFALAMRIKGESPDELAGFLDAVRERCMPVRPRRPVVVLPSYNGARRLPNLTPLLGLLLAQEGVPVLVHGPTQDPARVTTAEIFHDLGLPMVTEPAAIDEDFEAAASRREPLFVPIELLCPPLARLLHVRRVVGLRNSGHTVAKLLDPCRGMPSVRVCNYTHPEYGELLSKFLQSADANALLMRGTEGEPVADPRRLPRMELLLGGRSQPGLSVEAHDGVLTELPVLPPKNDAATTALYIQSVVSGEKPAPGPLVRQCELLRRAVVSLQDDITHQAMA